MGINKTVRLGLSVKTPDVQYWKTTKVSFHNCQHTLSREERAAREEMKRSYIQAWKEKRIEEQVARAEALFKEQYQQMVDLPNT